MKNLGENQDMPDLEQQRCSRTVYARSEATPMQQDCLRVILVRNRKSTHSRSGATPLPYADCSFARFDNTDLKQHRCYGTVHGSIRHCYDFCLFSALPSSCNTWHRLRLTLRIAFILQNMYQTCSTLMKLTYISLSGAWVPAPMRSTCIYLSLIHI